METLDKNPSWSFPDVEYLSEDGAAASHLKYQLKQLEIKANQLLKENEIKNNELENQRKFIEEINEKSKEQMDSFNNFLATLNESLPKLNDNHIDLITNVIGSLTKKIIYKELDKDNTIIKKMLSGLLSQVSEEELLTVEVSQRDYNILSQTKMPSNIKLTMKEGLEPGDITVLSKTNAYLQRIDEMIDLIVSK